MERVAQELMRALRGKRSQKAFARRLGYRGNPVTDWEHGRRYPRPREVLRIASRLGVDVPAAFARFVPAVTLEKDGHGFLIGPWLQALTQSGTIQSLASQSGFSRHALGRWLSGEREPRLPDFLRLVDVITGRLPDLVANLVPIEKVPALSDRFAVAQAARRVAFEEPWAEAMQRALETIPGNFAPGMIADRLGISRAEEARLLSLLEAAKLVRKEARRYVPLPPSTVDTSGGRAASLRLKHHWASIAAERASAPGDGDLFAYNVISLSAADLARVRACLHSTFREIRKIVAASEPTEKVALINLQLVEFNERAPGR